jgi:hypothetical protein
MNDAHAGAPAPPPSALDALGYEAPFLIEKLVKDRVVDSAEEGEALFAEVKKYLVMAATDESRSWHMHSLRIDAVWHQFILFTRQYMEFCRRYFGRYIPHSPSNAPELKGGRAAAPASFDEFRDRYRELFGMALPDLWLDARNVTVRRRVINDHAGALSLHAQGDEVELVAPGGRVLLCANALAQEALAFVAVTGSFYVRELPGDLTEEEKVGLVATLMECRVLRAAG